jgi:uncharacterized protein DUF6338
MPIGTKEALNVLILLLPGLVAVRVSSWFVRVGRPQGAELFVLVLIFDLAVYAIYGLILGVVGWISPSAEHSLSVALGLIAPPGISGFQPWPPLTMLVLGALVGSIHGLASSDNRLFEWVGLTKLSRNAPTPDAWGAVFSERRTPWITVELEDGRRIYGWPEYFGDTAENMDLFIRDPIVYVPDGESESWKEETGMYGILITKNEKVRIVHFYRPP